MPILNETLIQSLFSFLPSKLISKLSNGASNSLINQDTSAGPGDKQSTDGGKTNSGKFHQIYECADCRKCFTCPSGLKRHRDVHSTNRNYVCELCGMSYKQVVNLRKHERLKHDRNRLRTSRALVDYFDKAGNPCVYCGKRFKTWKILRVHINMIHSSLPPSFLCEQCGNTFKSSSNLNQHRRGMHIRNQYVCGLCNKEFNYQISLKRHMNKMHSDIGHSKPTQNDEH